MGPPATAGGSDWLGSNCEPRTCDNLSAMLRKGSNRDLVREFLTYTQVEKGLSRNTLQSYARDIAKLHSWAETNHKPVEKLDRKDLREWIARMSRDGLAPKNLPKNRPSAAFFRPVFCPICN